MQINLPYVAMIKNKYFPGQILNAVVTQKADGGYLINFCGVEVFARSDLELAAGQNLILRVIEASSLRVILKVLKTDTPAKSLQSDFATLLISRRTPETRAAVKLLSGLNLPITEERLSDVSRLLAGIVRNNSRPDPMSDKTDTFAEFLAVKALNLIYQQAGSGHIHFFILSPPLQKPVYFKVEDGSNNRGSSSATCLSFVADTETLGPILAQISLIGSSTAASLTFEEKKGLDAARKAISELGSEAGSLLKSLKLNMGKVSKEDFFFSQLKALEIQPGINFRV